MERGWSMGSVLGEYSLRSWISYKNRAQMVIGGVKHLLMGIGIISTVWVLIGSVIPYSHQLLAGFCKFSFRITSLREPFPLCIYIILNFIILITLAASSSSSFSSIFLRQNQQQQETHLEGVGNSEYHSSMLPQGQTQSQSHLGASRSSKPIPEDMTNDIATDDRNQHDTVPSEERRIEGNDIIVIINPTCQRQYQCHSSTVEEEDTLESTWKTITEERENPLNGRQLRKSET